MEAANQSLTAAVRHFLSRRGIERTVVVLATREMFFQSQSWEGYDRACESWHRAFWKWVGDEAPADLVERLEGLQIDWSKIPVPEDAKKLWLLEQSRQECLVQFALFQLAMSGPEAKDKATYGMFFDDMKLAHQIGAENFFEQLAKQKARKPSKGVGDRRLKYQLLFCWMAGCLWSFTTEGMAQFLHVQYPRSGNKPYDNKTIADAIHALKLSRSPKPLWWGISGVQPKLEPLS